MPHVQAPEPPGSACAQSGMQPPARCGAASPRHQPFCVCRSTVAPIAIGVLPGDVFKGPRGGFVPPELVSSGAYALVMEYCSVRAFTSALVSISQSHCTARSSPQNPNSLPCALQRSPALSATWYQLRVVGGSTGDGIACQPISPK